MNFINIISVIIGALLIFGGAFMMNRNYKPILAFFVILLGLLFILGAAFDPTATLPHYIMKMLNLHS